MSQSILSNQTQKPNPVELASAAVNHLGKKLPSGTAYYIGIVFIVMMTGRLASCQD